MCRVVSINSLFASVLVSLATVCGAEGSQTTLQTNPFERPPVVELQENMGMNNSHSASPTLQLRATMQAGPRSLADISGTIIGIGQKIDGYQLISVGERNVVLSKNGISKTLSVDN